MPWPILQTIRQSIHQRVPGSTAARSSADLPAPTRADRILLLLERIEAQNTAIIAALTAQGIAVPDLQPSRRVKPADYRVRTAADVMVVDEAFRERELAKRAAAAMTTAARETASETGNSQNP